MTKSVLVIDDNLTICLMLKSWLQKRGYDVNTATGANEAKKMVREYPYDLILCDIKMPDIDGLAFLSWVKKYDSDIMVIMMTGYADVDSAVESMKIGAVDYISKPIEPDKLFDKIDEAFLTLDNIKKNSRFSYELVAPPGKETKRLYKQLSSVAENTAHWLIIGERGTGKSTSVNFIYEKGIQFSGPLVKIDGNEISKTKGNNNDNGEYSKLKTMFQAAKGGVLYIREIDQFNSYLQDELLQLINKQKKNEDFTQVIMTSEKCIEELKECMIPKLFNNFVKDHIILPSLKGNKDYILYFASYFIEFANFTLNKEVEGMEIPLQKYLVEYDWPGNIQELKNIIIKAVLLTDDRIISSDIIPDLFENSNTNNKNQFASKTNLQSLRKENYEKEKICQALELSKGNKTMAASILNIDRKTLYNKIKLYNIVLQS